MVPYANNVDRDGKVDKMCRDLDGNPYPWSLRERKWRIALEAFQVWRAANPTWNGRWTKTMQKEDGAKALANTYYKGTFLFDKTVTKDSNPPHPCTIVARLRALASLGFCPKSSIASAVEKVKVSADAKECGGPYIDKKFRDDC